MTRPLPHFPSHKAPKRSFLWGTTQTHTGCSSVQSSSFMQLMSSGAVVYGFCADVDEGMDGNTGFRTGEELGVRNCMVIHVLSGIGVWYTVEQGTESWNDFNSKTIEWTRNVDTWIYTYSPVASTMYFFCFTTTITTGGMALWVIEILEYPDVSSKMSWWISIQQNFLCDN